MRPRVSVIIPTIEEEGVFRVIKDIRKLLGTGTEIIVVDKSSEKYEQRLRKAGVTVIRQRDSGVEKALMHGFRAAHGTILANTDGDGTHDTRGLVECVKLIQSGKADIVLANRLNRLEKGSMTPYLKFGNTILSGLFSSLYKVRIHDILTGQFAMRKSAFDEVREIEPYRSGNATTYAIELARRGYVIREVDIKYYKREHGESKIARHKSTYGLQVATNIIRQVRDYSPLAIFGALGVLLILVGLVLGGFVLASFLSSGQFSQIGRALLSFMLIVLGLLAIFTGVILDLLLQIDRRIGH